MAAAKRRVTRRNALVTSYLHSAIFAAVYTLLPETTANNQTAYTQHSIPDDSWLDEIIFSQSLVVSLSEDHDKYHSRSRRQVTGSGLSELEQLQTLIDTGQDPCKNGAEPRIETRASPMYIYCWCAAEYTHSSSDPRQQFCDQSYDDCTENVCGSAGASCTDLIRSSYNVGARQCVCDAGYFLDSNGICELTDNCAATPCQNGAQCTNGVNTYSCACPYGFEGTNCETNTNECAASTNPCGQGTCVDWTGEEAGFWCLCDDGYRGSPCSATPQVFTDIPLQLFLRNVVFCVPNIATIITVAFDSVFASDTNYHGVHSFEETCTLSSGIHDVTFKLRVTQSLVARKRRGANWRTTYNSQWRTGLEQVLSKFPNLLENNNVDTAIQNVVTAVRTGTDVGNGGVSLNHDSGVVHNNNLVLNEDLNACDNTTSHAHICRNGADCTDLVGNSGERTCHCKPGYTGDDCGTMIDNCANVTCQHEGTCRNLVNAFECICKSWKWEGTYCEKDTFCSHNTCQNGASCYDGYCHCDTAKLDNVEFHGALCQEKDYCTGHAEVTCTNKGECLSLTDSYICQCYAGYRSDHCEKEVNECIEPFSPCSSTGTSYCTDMVNDYKCHCLAPFTGKTCSTKINTCDSNPCLNGAICKETADAYRCECVSGFSGAHCQTALNHCQSAPCGAHGTCIDVVTTFTCQCNKNWSGDRCTTFINPCNSNKCYDLGTSHCIAARTTSSDLYNCICEKEYTGTYCDTKDPCKGDNSLCNDRGTCKPANTASGYKCICDIPWTGTKCDIPGDIDEGSTRPPSLSGSYGWAVNSTTYVFEEFNADLNDMSSSFSKELIWSLETEINLMFTSEYDGLKVDHQDVGVARVWKFSRLPVKNYCTADSHTNGLSSLVNAHFTYYVQSEKNRDQIVAYVYERLRRHTWNLDGIGRDFSFECSKYTAINTQRIANYTECWPGLIEKKRYCSISPSAAVPKPPRSLTTVLFMFTVYLVATI